MQAFDLLVNEIYALSAAFRRHGEALARQVGQTQAHWQVLRAASVGVLSVSQIARRLGVTRQNVQRIADRLVKERLVLRVVNIDHKSSPHIVLSDKGRLLLDRLSESSANYQSTLAPLLRGVDLDELLQTLRRLTAALAELDKDTGKLTRRQAGLPPPKPKRARSRETLWGAARR